MSMQRWWNRAWQVSLCVLLAGSRLAHAEHADILIAQTPDHVLVTGTADFDNLQWIVGARSFEGELGALPLGDDPRGVYWEADPGFNARTQSDLDADNPPAGSVLALPGSVAVRFSIAAPTVNGQVANLFYWDGNGAVNFQPATGTSLTVSVGSQNATANGLPTIVPGFTLQTTTSQGALHRHPDYTLDNGVAGTYAPAGIYLLPLIAQIDGLQDSALFTITFAAGDVEESVHEAATDWVAAHVVPEPSSYLLLVVGAGIIVAGRRAGARVRGR